MQLLYVDFVKSSDKLLNYLTFGQTVNCDENGNAENSQISPLVKFHNFVVIGERMEVTPMISLDPQSVYHFGYPVF